MKEQEPKLRPYECEVRWIEKHVGYENIHAYSKEDAEERLKRHIQENGFEALRSQHYEITKEKYKVKKS